MVCSRVLCPPRSQKRLGRPKTFWIYKLNCYFLKLTKAGKRGIKKHWKYKFSNVFLTWYKFNLCKNFKSNTKPNFKYCISLSKYRFGKDKSAIALLSTHLKYILYAPLSRTLNIKTYSAPCSGLKKSLCNS